MIEIDDCAEYNMAASDGMLYITADDPRWSASVGYPLYAKYIFKGNIVAKQVIVPKSDLRKNPWKEKSDTI